MAIRATEPIGNRINARVKFAVAIENYADFGPLQHFKAASAQSQTLFGVLDYGGASNGIEFGIGKGLTRATDSRVLELMLMHVEQGESVKPLAFPEEIARAVEILKTATAGAAPAKRGSRKLELRGR